MLRYLTPDWQAAFELVKKLEALKPSVAITGHGLPMEGKLRLIVYETLYRNLIASLFLIMESLLTKEFINFPVKIIWMMFVR